MLNQHNYLVPKRVNRYVLVLWNYPPRGACNLNQRGGDQGVVVSFRTPDKQIGRDLDKLKVDPTMLPL